MPTAPARLRGHQRQLPFVAKMPGGAEEETEVEVFLVL